MPISLDPISRRHFLGSAVAAGTALALPHDAWAADATVDANRFALLADTHIAGDAAQVLRGANMHDHLQAVTDELIAIESERPAAVMINGDCALTSGQAEDYQTLIKLLGPLREAGYPVHVTLGNHDHRQRFWEALPADAGQDERVDQRHLTIVESPLADWLLLDSLDKVNNTPGELGEAQLDWLEKTLAARSDKPVIVYVHHNPDRGQSVKGLTDTEALLELLVANKQVKAMIFGHTHNWNIAEQDGLHLVNLPPVAYVFNKKRPSGWVNMQLSESGAKLTLHSRDKEHAEHGKQLQLKWRA